MLEPEEGIGPGTQLRIGFPDGSGSGCTANFIWADPAGDLYLGTAGHCLLPSGTNGTHGPGWDHRATDVVVDAAVEGCSVEPSTFVAATGGCLQEDPRMERLGEVVYAVQTTAGHDFGLVEIPEHLEDDLRYELPHWGGPQGEASIEATGETVLFYGQGLGWEATPATRAREGQALDDEDLEPYSEDGRFYARAEGNFGDSGAAVVLAQDAPGTDRPQGGPALGILTTGFPPIAGTISGPTVSRVKADVLCYTGLSISVVPGGSPLGSFPEACSEECPDACGPNLEPGLPRPRFGASCDGTECTFDATETTGDVESYTWTFGDGTTSTVASPTVTHGYDAVDAYEVRLRVESHAGAATQTRKMVNLLDRGSLYLMAQPWAEGTLSEGPYSLTEWGPSDEESEKAYAELATPAGGTPTEFHYEVVDPMHVEGDVEVSLYLSCDVATVAAQPEPFVPVVLSLQRNGEKVGGGDAAENWVCVEGEVTHVEATLSSVDAGFDRGDVLTVGVLLQTLDTVPQNDLHILVDSTIHPSQLNGPGLPGAPLN